MEMVDKKNGVVALLDILGVSSMNIEDCQELLQLKRKLIYETQQTDFCRLIENVSDLRIYQFGDSILLCTSYDRDLTKEFSHLTAVAVLLKRFILEGLGMGLLIRGAISCGVYIADTADGNATVIGPAIADVASWYEEAQWAGVIVTPRAGHILEAKAFSEKGNMSYALYKSFHKAAVPLKSGSSQMWALNWPLELRSDIPADRQVLRQKILDDIARISSVPKGTEIKYFNTMQFAHDCWKNEDKSA